MCLRSTGRPVQVFGQVKRGDAKEIDIRPEDSMQKKGTGEANSTGSVMCATVDSSNVVVWMLLLIRFLK